ncbi:MAG: MBL fold metallo-hydrolase, partial [Gammaproteobacteria bacterium]|nr:MBL fold metallo-hydrolase [Gammaproteobacteria bacterium]
MKYPIRTLAFIAGVILSAGAFAQDDPFANVTIQTVPVAGNISMLIGQGGNIGVSAGEDGVLII